MRDVITNESVQGGVRFEDVDVEDEQKNEIHFFNFDSDRVMAACQHGIWNSSADFNRQSKRGPLQTLL